MKRMNQFLLYIIYLLIYLTLYNSKLITLITLSRHGSRAPNPIVRESCPNNHKNINSYKVPLTQLTEVGMEQMMMAGKHINDVYIKDKKYLSSSINGELPFIITSSHLQTYFRSDSADRCAQSAISLGYGLYPDGTGPSPFFKQPISNYMQLKENEHVFSIPKNACHKMLKKDLDEYARNRGRILFDRHYELINKLSDICGVEFYDIPKLPHGEDIMLGLKDIADMFEFDQYENYTSIHGLTQEIINQTKHLAYQMLVERYYATPRMITYWSGDFPKLILKNLNDNIQAFYSDFQSDINEEQEEPVDVSKIDKNEKKLKLLHNRNKPKVYKYYSYHGHRELLYALGFMLGWQFDFPDHPVALNMSAIPPATTMFFELHAPTPINIEEPIQYHIETYIWAPKYPRKQVKLNLCSNINCPFLEFTEIIANHTKKTGTWNDICDYHYMNVNTTVQNIINEYMNKKLVTRDGYSMFAVTGITLMTLFLGIFLGAATVYVTFRSQRRKGYESL